jgi:hypothetical protein
MHRGVAAPMDRDPHATAGRELLQSAVDGLVVPLRRPCTETPLWRRCDRSNFPLQSNCFEGGSPLYDGR